MSKVIKQVHRIEVSGYVRGYKTKVHYYDYITKELIDSETLDDLELIRDDTKSGDSYCNFDETKPFKIEEE